MYLFLFILIFLLINEILLKKNILIDNLSFSKHKKLIRTKVMLIYRMENTF